MLQVRHRQGTLEAKKKKKGKKGRERVEFMYIGCAQDPGKKVTVKYYLAGWEEQD